MFSRKFFIFVLFVGQLVSSDKKSENKLQNWSNAFDKKAVISLGVGIVVSVISYKSVFLAPKAKYLDGFLVFDPMPFFLVTLIAANFKVIPLRLAQKNKTKKAKISFENGQRMCSFISVAHGCFAAAICHYGLKQFFSS